MVISGCSGGGKSTLLTELGRRGMTVVEEPGRRIVRDERARGGSALPWADGAAFARRAAELALSDRDAARSIEDWVFFDRGLVDAVAAFRHLTGRSDLDVLCDVHRYHRQVFLAPPWRELYRGDEERRHGFEDAVAEYERLRGVYPALGYELIVLPRTSVVERADFMLSSLAK